MDCEGRTGQPSTRTETETLKEECQKDIDLYAATLKVFLFVETESLIAKFDDLLFRE